MLAGDGGRLLVEDGELNAPARLRVVEEDGQVVVSTALLRVTVRRAPFSVSVARHDGTRLFEPPSDADAGLAPFLHVSGEAERAGWEAVYQPDSRYLGFTYEVDGSLLGGYVGTGRRRRWYSLVQLRTWQQHGNLVRLMAATNDHVPRAAELTLELLDEAVLRLRLDLGQADGVVQVGCASRAATTEGFFGLGERFGRANHRGHHVVNWTEDSPNDPRPGHDWTYWPVPFMLSSRGYAILLDTTRRADLHLGDERTDAWVASVDGRELNLIVIDGPRPADVLRRYSALVGRPPLLPPWGLGVWKTTLGGSERVMREAQHLRNEDLGVSAVWIYDQLEPDLNSGWGSAMGYPDGRYDDLPGLVGHLHAEDFRVLGYVYPQFPTERAAFAEGARLGAFLKRADGSIFLVASATGDASGDYRRVDAGLLDPTSSEGVAWWQGLLRRLLLETGYDGWMHDFGEGTPVEAVFADGRTGREIRNLYPTLYQRAGAELCRAVKPDFVFFVRSGYTGSHRWAPAAWPGDQHCDWSADRGLAGVVPAGLSVAMCGANTWGPDIGGFFAPSDPAGPRSRELWIRWCQFGALTPTMRDHLGDKRRVVPDAVDLWSDRETIDTWRRYARLHNALVPYLYACAAVAHRTGLPTLRHMVLHHPDDPNVLDQDHTYFLGPELLVAPVVEEHARVRRVYLPGGRWVHFWDEALLYGPGYHEVPAPLEQIPLLVRAGSVLPLAGRNISTLAWTRPEDLLEDLHLYVYPWGDGASPDVSSFEFHDGSSLQLSETADRLALQFDGAPDDRSYAVRLPSSYAVSEVLADGAELSPTAPPWSAEPRGGATWLRLPRGVRRVDLRYRLHT